uniref:Ig-like domain-containing protein n=1 Tax=Zosterops lateralis melanops TaxID=1220523 RepID=A0A8D2PR64_ZOSLA
MTPIPQVPHPRVPKPPDLPLLISPSPTLCHPAFPVMALAGWCPLSLTGAQTTQLLVEPPWRPAVLWDRVTLTCQGSGTAGDTTWYKDGQQWGQKGPDNVTVTESGTYQCDRPGTGHSPTVNVSNDLLVLQVPARPLLEGDTVTLRCRGWWDMSVTLVQFYHGDKEVSRSIPGTELSLSPLQLHHSGQYHCRGQVDSSRSLEQHKSKPVTVTVHGEPHPHSLPGFPGWGHSALSHHPLPESPHPPWGPPHPSPGVPSLNSPSFLGVPFQASPQLCHPSSSLESPHLSPHPPPRPAMSLTVPCCCLLLQKSQSRGCPCGHRNPGDRWHRGAAWC